jgi:hypothetical protein
MKQIVILLFIILYGSSTMAQKLDSVVSQDQLIGFWQINSPKVSSALNKNFRFFPDGKYVLSFDNYDDTKRVLSLAGHYRLEKNKLFMTVESRKEIIGGDFAKGSPGFQRDEFVLDGGKVEVITQKDSSGSDPFLISILGTSKSGKITCIKIDNNKYYKLSSDPSSK